MSYCKVNCLEMKKLGRGVLIFKLFWVFFSLAALLAFMKVYIMALNLLGQTHLSMCFLVK